MNRTFRAFAHAVGASLVTMLLIFGVGIWIVRDSPDGQAGMGPFFLAIGLGGLVFMIVFVVSAMRCRPSP